MRSRLAIGTETVPTRGDAHDTFVGIIDIVIGLGCVAAARQVRRSAQSGQPPRRRFAGVDAKRRAMLDRLSALRPAALAGSGALLGVGGPKRLVVTLLATASIAAAHVSTTGEVGLVGLYAALATVLVWLPVVLTVLWGQRAAEWTASGRDWCVRHRPKILSLSLVLLGVYFLIAGMAHLA